MEPARNAGSVLVAVASPPPGQAETPGRPHENAGRDSGHYATALHVAAGLEAVIPEHRSEAPHVPVDSDGLVKSSGLAELTPPQHAFAPYLGHPRSLFVEPRSEVSVSLDPIDQALDPLDLTFPFLEGTLRCQDPQQAESRVALMETSA